MDPFEPLLVLKKEVRFSEILAEANLNCEENFDDVFGGIFKSGQWGWLTKGSHLRITSLRTGQLICKFDFDDSNGFGVCIITCVSEIQLPYVADTTIAIGIQYADSPGGLAVIYSIEESTVLRCIELKHKITCCKFISHEASQHTVLQNMNGCLAVGTDGGSVLLVDMNLRHDDMNASTVESDVSVVPCHIVDYSMSLLHLHRHFQHCQQEGVHFGIQLEVLENAKFVQSLLPIDPILSLAVGLSDGRLVLYDLTDMQVFYVAPPQERSSPLVKMNFMEPPDDPRPCVYIWAFHENYQNSMAVMHSLMYEKRMAAEDGFCYYENFQVSCVRLLLPLNTPKSVPITCQAITKAPSHGNEETISLCALVWKQDQEVQTEVLLFDINQWYKEEMPYVGDWREDPSYLASFVLAGLSALEVYFDPYTISLFNSIQRPEEHFYPVSLSFDSIALGEKGCAHLNWPGAQNRLINVLRSKGSLALLDPNPIFNEVLNTRLLPQFSGLNYKSTFSLKAKRETLLSVAVEQNCIGLLKECIRNWSDGSHQGKSLAEGLSMSILTDWLWARASSIKERCNTLCQMLFDHSGCTLDQREQKELGYISKQLKTLADLLSEIILKFSENIPSDVLSTLESQSKLIRMASDYQEILLWLLNIGLLPEGTRTIRNRDVHLNLVPYPYESLKRFYEDRRMDFTRLNEKFASRKTRSCYLLFIDSFIEHEFKGNSLRDSWQESGGDGLYPPTSIQAMLRIMLIPDVTFDNKCALFLYFFLDLNMAIEDKRYEPIVQNFIKFPSVFKLSASLIKQIQAFWNLDHCRFQAAVDEFISPFNKDQVCPQWQLELFLESLLAQSEANLALRVLEAKSSPISPVLQLNTYLANDLVSEAFHFARSKQDEDLLKLFFTGCLCTGKFGVIRDLALTESEGNLVQSLLKNSKSRNAENLHFVYLLQKYKYIEAVSYLDELSKGRTIQRAVDVDTPSLVLSAYNTTMTPVTKGLSDVYFKIKNKIKSKESEQNSPYPLSCQLIKQNANDLLGGIYHSSALSAHFASHYWERHQSERNAIQQSTNAPFLRRPQVASSYTEYNQKESISYPDPYKAAEKRRLDNSPIDEGTGSKIRENPKKRRKIYDRSDLIYKPLSREQSTADNLLTQFKNTTTHSQDISSFTKKLQTTPPRDTPFLLETPYIRKTATDNSGTVTRSQTAEKTATSLQSILKGSHSNRSDEPDRVKAASFDSDKRDKKDTEEEKSIRFILPSVEDESEEQIDEENVAMESEEIEEQSREELPEMFRRHTGPAKRKSLRAYSSYVPSVRVIGSKSPFKTDTNKNTEERSPSRNASVECRKVMFQKSEEEGRSNLNVAGGRSVLKTVRIEDAEEEPLSASKGLANTTESRASCKKIWSEEFQRQPPTRMSVSPSIVVGSRPSLRETKAIEVEQPDIYVERESLVATPKMSVSPRVSLREVIAKEIEQQTSPLIPVNLTEPKWILQNVSDGDSENQSPLKQDTPGKVTIIPVTRLDVNYSARIQLEFEDISSGAERKQSKRPLSESTDGDSNESVHFTQPSAKQLKGRVSIHSSSSDISDHRNPESDMQTKSDLHAQEHILTSGTISDFKPQVSSSRVCATESKFNASESKGTFSERSTVVGGLSYMSTLETVQNVSETVNVTIQPRNETLDTTVGMTLYETLGLDQPNEDSNSQGAASQSSDTEEGHALEKSESEEDDDSDSVILLSSHSSSQTYNGNGSECSNSRPNETTSRLIVIDDEEDNENEDEDEESDGIDVIERYSDGSEDSNSFSNQFSEVSVTRTSTSYSIPSNTDTVLSSATEVEAEAQSFNRPLREVEEGEDNAEIVNEESSTVTSIESETYAADKMTSKGEIKPSENKNLKPSNNEALAIEEVSSTLNISASAPVEEEALESRANVVAEIEKVTRKPELLEEDNETMENEAKRVKVSDDQEEKIKVVVEEENKIEENVNPSEENKSDEPNSQNTTIEEQTKSEEPAAERTEIEKPKIDSTASADKVILPKESLSDSLVEVSTTDALGKEKEKQQNVEEVLTPNSRGRRSKSITRTRISETDFAASPISRRQSRGGSMPPTTANPIVTRRRSMLLETLDENLTPDSPSSRTRSKLRSDSIDGDVESPSVSNIKRNRLSSVSSVDHPQTPKSRRRSSTSADKEPSNTPKATATPRTTRAKSITTELTTTPIKTPRRLSISKKSISPSDQSSPVEGSSKAQTEEEVSKTPEAETDIFQSDDYKSSRRLTRTQLAVLERSSALSKQISISPVRVTRRRASRNSEKDSTPLADVKGSDNESLSSRHSRQSNTSSRRVTRSSALREIAEDDVMSVASSTESGTKRRKRTKEATSPITPLTAIPEEEPSGSEGSVANSEISKRSRRQKK